MAGGIPSSQGLNLKVCSQTLAFLTGFAEGAYQGHGITPSEMKALRFTAGVVVSLAGCSL